MLESFHGFPSFHKSLFVKKNIKKYFEKDWIVKQKTGYLKSEIEPKLLKLVEQESRTKNALIFELRKK